MKGSVSRRDEGWEVDGATGTLCESPLNRWVRPRVVLVATDLTDLDRLTPFAMQQALETGGQLLFLHVVAGGNFMAADASGMPYYDPTGAMDSAAKLLEPMCALAGKLGIRCHALVREGNPAREIGVVTRQFKAGRLILGTRSRSRLGKVLLGSVTERVLHSVNVPVLTVGPEAHLQAGEAPLRRFVIHPTSLGETSRTNAALAAEIAAAQEAKLALLYVMPSPECLFPDLPFPYFPNLEQPAANYRSPSQTQDEAVGQSGRRVSVESSAFQQLRELGAEVAQRSGTEVEPVAVYGNASIEILAEAHARGAQLIVLGARHPGVFASIPWDRISSRVLVHARCPVLTLHHLEDAEAAKTTLG